MSTSLDSLGSSGSPVSSTGGGGSAPPSLDSGEALSSESGINKAIELFGTGTPKKLPNTFQLGAHFKKDGDNIAYETYDSGEKKLLKIPVEYYQKGNPTGPKLAGFIYTSVEFDATDASAQKAALARAFLAARGFRQKEMEAFRSITNPSDTRPLEAKVAEFGVHRIVMTPAPTTANPLKQTFTAYKTATDTTGEGFQLSKGGTAYNLANKVDAYTSKSCKLGVKGTDSTSVTAWTANTVFNAWLEEMRSVTTSTTTTSSTETSPPSTGSTIVSAGAGLPDSSSSSLRVNDGETGDDIPSTLKLTDSTDSIVPLFDPNYLVDLDDDDDDTETFDDDDDSFDWTSTEVALTDREQAAITIITADGLGAAADDSRFAESADIQLSKSKAKGGHAGNRIGFHRDDESQQFFFKSMKSSDPEYRNIQVIQFLEREKGTAALTSFMPWAYGTVTLNERVEAPAKFSARRMAMSPQEPTTKSTKYMVMDLMSMNKEKNKGPVNPLADVDLKLAGMGWGSIVDPDEMERSWGGSKAPGVAFWMNMFAHAAKSSHSIDALQAGTMDAEPTRGGFTAVTDEKRFLRGRRFNRSAPQALLRQLGRANLSSSQLGYTISRLEALMWAIRDADVAPIGGSIVFERVEVEGEVQFEPRYIDPGHMVINPEKKDELERHFDGSDENGPRTLEITDRKDGRERPESGTEQLYYGPDSETGDDVGNRFEAQRASNYLGILGIITVFEEARRGAQLLERARARDSD